MAEKKISYEVDFAIKGIGNLISQLKGMTGAEKGIKSLSEIIAMLMASKEIIKGFNNAGMSNELNSYISSIEKAIARINKIKTPNNVTVPEINIQSGNAKRELKPAYNNAINEFNKMPIISPQEVKNAKDVQKSTSEIKKDVEDAGYKAKTLRQHFTDSVKEMFSMHKLISRISFVITAMFSYMLMDKVIAGIKSSIFLLIDFKDELTKTFALVDGMSIGEKTKMIFDVSKGALKYRMELNDVAKAMYEIISAQIAVKDSTTVLEASLKLAKGGFADTRDAALSLIQIMNAFDLSAERAYHIADVAFQTSKLGIITTQQYSEQISKVASTASLFGISIEEVSAAISSMTRNGVKVDQAFTSLNQLLMTIANPTSEAEKLLEKYGLSLSIADVRANGLANTLLKLRPLLTNEEDATTIFKTRTGFKAAASLSQNYMDEVSDLLGMFDSVGVAERASNERLSTTKSLLEDIKAQAIQLGLKIGKALEPVVKSFAILGSSAIKNITKNLDLILASIKGIVAFITVQLIQKSLISIGTALLSIYKTITSIKINSISALTLIGNVAKITMAQITAGISLIIGFIIEAISWISALEKRAKSAKIDNIMDTGSIENKLKNVNSEIEKIDSNLAKIEGLSKLAKQSDETYKSIVKNTKASEDFYKANQKVADAIGQIIGKTIDYKVVAGNLSQFESQLNKIWIEGKLKEIDLILRKTQLETASNISDSLKEIKIKIDKSKEYDLLNPEKYDFKTAKQEKEKYDKESKIDKRNYNIIAKYLLSISEQEKNINQNTPKETIDLYSRRLDVAEKLLKNYPGITKEGKELKDKGNEIVNQLKIYINNIMQSQIDKLNVQMPSSNINSGSGKSSEITQVEPIDKVNEYVDAVTDLFRKVGLQTENNFIDSIGDLKRKIERDKKINAKNKIFNQMKGNENKQKPMILLPSKEEEELIDKISLSISGFEDIDKAFKEKTDSIDEVIKNQNKIQFIFNNLNSKESLDKIKYLANEMQKSNNKEYQDIGKVLVSFYSEKMDMLAIDVANNKENKFQSLLSKAKTKDEAGKILEKITSSYEGMIERINNSTYDELQEITEDDSVDKNVKEYAKFVFEKRQKQFAESLKTMIGYYGYVLKDIDKNMKDISDLLKYVGEKIKPFGVSLNDFYSLIIAISDDNSKEINKITNDLLSKGISSDKIDVVKENIKQIMPEGFDDYTAKEKRKWKKENLGSMYDSKLSKIKESDRNVGDVIKNALGINEELSLGEAFNIAESGIMETSKKLWSQYWDDKIKMAEDAKNKLLEIEESRKNAMLANENMSSSQREAISQRYEERKRKITEKEDKKIAELKKKQALNELKIELAKSLGMIWARELGTKGAIGIVSAGILSALLTAKMLVESNIIQKTKFAKGTLDTGYAPSGVKADSTGQKPVGIVHEKEMVVDRFTLNRNPELKDIYGNLRNGKSLNQILANYFTGTLKPVNVINNSGLFASGGYSSIPQIQNNEPINVNVDFNGVNVLDDIDLSVRVEKGSRRRRSING